MKTLIDLIIITLIFQCLFDLPRLWWYKYIFWTSGRFVIVTDLEAFYFILYIWISSPFFRSGVGDIFFFWVADSLLAFTSWLPNNLVANIVICLKDKPIKNLSIWYQLYWFIQLSFYFNCLTYNSLMAHYLNSLNCDKY